MLGLWRLVRRASWGDRHCTSASAASRCGEGEHREVQVRAGPGPKESTRTHEDRGNGFWLITTDAVGPQGQKTHGAYVYKPDGKQYPVAGMNQTTVNTIALTIVDPYTVTFTQFVNGKEVATGKRTVAKDGKTMMIETKGTNPQGQPASSSVLWEKQ